MAYWSAYANEYLHMCPHSAMYVCRYAAFRKRVEFGSHPSYGNGGHRRGVYMSDPRYESGGGGGGGGAVRFRPFIHPCTVYLLNGEGDLALGRGSVNPPTSHLPPLRRIRHVVTQWYVLLFLIMCAYGLAVYNVK